MSNEITTTKSFQEKMFEKIREQMGDLMSEDDLKLIVNSAMEKAFFQGEDIRDRWGNLTKREESLFITLIKREMEPKVKEAIKEWFSNHPEEVKNAIDSTIAKGMFTLIKQHIESVCQGPIQELAHRLQSNCTL